MLKRITSEFPDSSARNYFPYINALFQPMNWIANLSERSHVSIDLKECIQHDPNPPTMWHIHSAVERAASLGLLGKWRQAWEEMQELYARLTEAQRKHFMFQPSRQVLALATGREEELINAYDLTYWSTWSFEHYTGIPGHCAIRRGEVSEFIQRFRRGDRQKCHFEASIPQIFLFVLLSHHDLVGARYFIEGMTEAGTLYGGDLLGQGYTITDAQDDELVEHWIAKIARFQKDEGAYNQVVPALRARLALERGDWKTAATHIQQELSISKGVAFVRLQLLLRIVIGSGADIGLSKREMLKQAHEQLAGPHLELALICLQEQKPAITDLWPHPKWMPELRLWLALWLEAQGKKSQAYNVAEPAIDNRYGLMHCQPALKKLLQRVSSK